MPTTDNHRLKLSIVVPCHNEADNIVELWRRASAAAEACVGDEFELVLVNDGSSDSTWSVIAALAEAEYQVVSINLSRNYGHQLALTAGLTYCSGDRILVLDADLQDPPELITEMMSLMDEGADVVYGQRKEREGETWFKKASASWFYWLLRKSVDIEIPANAGDFRLVSRRVVDAFLSMPEQHRFVRGMVSWIGFKQVALQYDRAPRLHGETSYTLGRMLRFAADAITGFSTKPLRVASYLGILSGAFGIVLLIYILISLVAARPVAGWTSLMAVVAVLGSATLVVLGVIGEYVGRMYVEVKGRPLYLVSDVVGSDNPGIGAARCPHCGMALSASHGHPSE